MIKNSAEKEDEDLLANESPEIDDSLIWLDEDGNLNRNNNALIADESPEIDVAKNFMRKFCHLFVKKSNTKTGRSCS